MRHEYEDELKEAERAGGSSLTDRSRLPFAATVFEVHHPDLPILLLCTRSDERPLVDVAIGRPSHYVEETKKEIENILEDETKSTFEKFRLEAERRKKQKRIEKNILPAAELIKLGFRPIECDLGSLGLDKGKYLYVKRAPLIQGFDVLRTKSEAEARAEEKIKRGEKVDEKAVEREKQEEKLKQAIEFLALR